MMMMQNRQDFEGAWGSAPGLHPHQPPPPPPPGAMMDARGGGGAGWANEFHGGGGGGPEGHEQMMQRPPHPAELEAAWAAERHQAEIHEMSLRHAAGQAGPLLRGPAGPSMPPPAAFRPGLAPGADGQVTTLSATTADHPLASNDSSTPSASGADTKLFRGGDGRRRGALASAADAGADVEAGIGSIGGADAGPGVEERGGGQVGASARALAGEMASDPEGRFRDSELLRFAGRLGTGGLRVSGDKVH